MVILAWVVGILFSVILIKGFWDTKRYDKGDLVALLVISLPIILSALVVSK